MYFVCVINVVCTVGENEISRQTIQSTHGFHQKHLLKFQDFHGHFSHFPGLFPSKSHDFPRSFNEIPGLSRTLTELYE